MTHNLASYEAYILIESQLPVLFDGLKHCILAVSAWPLLTSINTRNDRLFAMEMLVQLSHVIHCYLLTPRMNELHYAS